MGTIYHHAIVVTADADDIREAHGRAIKTFPWVSTLSPNGLNGYQSFFIPPDGSKEGWSESLEGNDLRDEFIYWLDSQAYNGGSSRFDWVEVGYGGSEADASVSRYKRD